MSAAATSGKTKTTGKIQPSRPPAHTSAAHQTANGTVMKKGCCPGASSAAPVAGNVPMQAKLTVGQPNDAYEQQADSMAQKVVSMTPEEAARRGQNRNGNSPQQVSRKALQKKEQPGTFLSKKGGAEKEAVQKKPGEKVLKVSGEKVQQARAQAKADEKVQKLPEADKQKRIEKIEKKPDDKVQKLPEAEKQKRIEKIEKKADEKVQKLPEVDKQKRIEKLEKKPDDKVQKKEEEKIQKVDDKIQKTDDKIQKAAEEKVQKAPEKIVQAATEKAQAKPTAAVIPPVQKKEEEKIQKVDDKLQKAAEKKGEEKIQKAPEKMVQAAAEKVQAKPAAVVAPPVLKKEEEKIQKADDKLQKAAEKKGEEKIQKAPEKMIQPVADKMSLKPATTAPIQKKEEEKVQKKDGEKLQKTEAEKVQKKTDDKVLKAAAPDIQAKPAPQVAKTPVAPPVLKKEEEKIQKEEEKVSKADDKKIRASAQQEGSDEVSPEIEARLNTQRTGGEPLPRGVRFYMEQRFGVDFGAVRIHTDGEAARLCAELGAQAFAWGNHIFFARGKFQPDTDAGRFLLAHELTHVIQQGFAGEEGGGQVQMTAEEKVQKVEEKVQKATDEKIQKAEEKVQKASDEKIQKAEEKVQAVPEGFLQSPRKVQRLGLSDILDGLAALAANLPGYTLLTVIIGRNPINMRSVDRSPVNILRGFIGLIAGGEILFQVLNSYGVAARIANWIATQVNAMGITFQALRDAFNRFTDSLSWTDIFSPGDVWRRAENIFTPFITRIGAFVSALTAQAITWLKETFMQPLSNFCREIPGYTLVTVLLGRDPFTNAPVARSAINIVRAFAEFIPGGTEKVQQLQESRALERAAEWFNTETRARNLTWDRVVSTFAAAWNSLRLEDVLSPIETLRRLVNQFTPLFTDLVGFARAALEKLLELIFEAVMGAGGADVLAIIKRARSTFLVIIRDPVGFLGNLLRAVGAGIRQFGTNILRHLQQGVIAWLTGPVARAGIQMPERWDVRGIIWFVMQILGLTWDRVRAKLVTLMGERVVAGLETAAGLIMDIRERGLVNALRERATEFFGQLREAALGGIRSFIQQRLVMAGIQQLVSMLSPVGAVIQAIIKTYTTIQFFLQKINQIMAIVRSVVDSVAAIASGNIANAANFIEQTMARTIPILLDFLARFIGLGDVGAAVQRVIQNLQSRVDGMMDRAAQWIRTMVGRLVQTGRNAVAAVLQWWRTRKQFRTRTGETHTLFFRGEGPNAELRVASVEQSVVAFFAPGSPAYQFVYGAPGTQPNLFLGAPFSRGTQLVNQLRGRLANPVGITQQEAQQFNTDINLLSEQMAIIMDAMSGAAGNVLPDTTSPVGMGVLRQTAMGLSGGSANQAGVHYWIRLNDNARYINNFGVTHGLLSSLGQRSNTGAFAGAVMRELNARNTNFATLGRAERFITTATPGADTHAERRAIQFARTIRSTNPIIKQVDVKVYSIFNTCDQRYTDNPASPSGGVRNPPININGELNCQATGFDYANEPFQNTVGHGDVSTMTDRGGSAGVRFTYARGQNTTTTANEATLSV